MALSKLDIWMPPRIVRNSALMVDFLRSHTALMVGIEARFNKAIRFEYKFHILSRKPVSGHCGRGRRDPNKVEDVFIPELSARRARNIQSRSQYSMLSSPRTFRLDCWPISDSTDEIVSRFTATRTFLYANVYPEVISPSILEGLGSCHAASTLLSLLCHAASTPSSVFLSTQILASQTRTRLICSIQYRKQALRYDFQKRFKESLKLYCCSLAFGVA
ncbi:hypothetical protein F5890DRAFT_1532652 [Lentinula detonsa]|uniref:Uncharacterized protein n=1 Tax=Lentinula detonsa TaxID=2804962 RepID=A0AA38PUF3_9AGAR|nr:hypothetical protein F5890DRAFT_1532652 [Lentinula detonsa]